jgi:hypothetical protein
MIAAQPRLLHTSICAKPLDAVAICNGLTRITDTPGI